MKRLAAATVFGLLLLVAGAGQTGQVRQIAPGVWYREAEPAKRIIANTGWVEFRDYVLVIDANFPWGARPALEDIRRTTQKPIRFVFDTHYHSDHAFGNSIFVDAGATVICTEDCGVESREKNPAQWAASADVKELASKDRLEHPQILFRERMVLDDGSRRVELLKMGPGHTRGDAVAWLPKERILFTGDLCLNRPGNNIADRDADPDGWVRGLDRMMQLEVATLIPGHGAQGNKATVVGQRAYLADMVRQVRSGIERGVAVDQLEKQVDLSSHKPWGQDETRNRVSVRAVYAKLRP